MSHDVERLAKVLYEGMPCPLGRWEDLSDAVRGTWFAIARSAMKAGVTLPTPPRATPLEAAARALSKHLYGTEIVNDRDVVGAIAAITAAVGALSDEAVIDLVLTPSGDALRAALLAWLTEGAE